jgi:hypothetical protein
MFLPTMKTCAALYNIFCVLEGEAERIKSGEIQRRDEEQNLITQASWTPGDQYHSRRHACGGA